MSTTRGKLLILYGSQTGTSCDHNNTINLTCSALLMNVVFVPGCSSEVAERLTREAEQRWFTVQCMSCDDYIRQRPPVNLTTFGAYDSTILCLHLCAMM